jgi:nitrile hydratase subunit beta
MNGVHDMGGMHGFGPIRPRDNDEPLHADWEGRVNALVNVVRARGVFNIDESRHGIERMDPAAYLRASYYERWLASLETNLMDKGVLTAGEVEARMAQLEGAAEVARRDDPDLARAVMQARMAPGEPPQPGPSGFKPGDAVRTRNVHPTGHTRLPRYARGKAGVIDRFYGIDTLPDANAHGRGPAPEPLYSVRFTAQELWGASAEPNQTVNIDLWESYLEPKS